jgi:FAD/FMN-containing dehydrogenase
MRTSRRELLARCAAGAAVVAVGRPGDVAQARLPGDQLRALRGAVRGRVLTPGTGGYDHARVVFNRRFDGLRPPAVVQVRDAADVRAVVRWAGRYDVALTPRSGGNGYNGNSTSRDAVVVDVGALDHIALRGDTATIGPAARILDIYTRLAARGATIPAGSCPDVALGGHVLGGGMGLAGRALGLALDRATAFDVVTADGRARTVDARHDPDLFWALRGGGGSFALVTAVHLQVRRGLDHAAWFRVTYPRRARDAALAAWDALAPTAPRALTAICTLTSTGASAFGQYLGAERALRGLVGPLARVEGAQLRTGTSNYLALQHRWAGCAPGAACGDVPRSVFDASSAYVGRRLTAAGRRAFVAAADGGATLVCDAYGGAVNAVDADATAFVHRDARFSVQILSYAALPAARARVGHARALIDPYANGEAYQNYPDLRLTSAQAARAWYGANLDRLVAVKTAVDPEDRFQVAQGIRPRR